MGISSCLLGEPVRFDGGHKRDRFLVEALGRFVEWVPVCPEVELGMGIPREPVHLLRVGRGLRMVGTQSGRDWTGAMEEFSRRRVRALARLELSGYVLKKDSPSCGMERVKVHGPAGVARRTGRGVFAAALLAAVPALPVEEEGRLQDPVLRENWIERVFAYRRLRGLFARPPSASRLADFHAAHELQLLVHSPDAARRLGRLVAGGHAMPRKSLRERYEREFMATLARPSTPGRHAKVLRRCLGHFEGAARAALAAKLTDYEGGLVPLVVPIRTIRHAAERLGIGALLVQSYLEPHPAP